MLYLVGRIIDLENRRLRYRAISQGTYVGYAIVAIALLYLDVLMVHRPDILLAVPCLSALAMVLGYGLSLFSIVPEEKGDKARPGSRTRR